MPTYDYECEKCGKEVTKFRLIADRHNLLSCECGGKCKKIVGLSRVNVFKPLFMTNLDVNPVWVESKKQLREECKKRGVMAASLM